MRALLGQDNCKTTDVREYWKGELSKAIRDIQGEYERQLDVIRGDVETRLQSQMQELSAGSQKEALALGMVKEESLKLKGKLKDYGGRMVDMESQVYNVFFSWLYLYIYIYITVENPA
jgi:hypothetical protein